MKLHHNLLTAMSQALQAIFEQNGYADKVMERLLKSNPKWGARDRAFLAEGTYEIVRNWRLYQEIAQSFNKKDYWTIIGIWLILQKEILPEWNEWKDLNIVKVKEQFTDFQKVRKIKESVPDWLDELGQNELQEKWEATLSALNQQAKLVLRANTLKIEAKDLQSWFDSQGIVSKLLGEEGLEMSERQNIFKTEAFLQGAFEVQDFSSQQVAPFLDVKQGMRVVDACAGAGGKTLHLAALMQDKGKIIALDTEEWKLNELKKRAKRAEASIIETRLIDNKKTIKRLYDTADRLLLDVPCSGLGVIRRNPDAKWKLDLDFIEKVQTWQRDILQSYSPICKKNGKIVYATCSILPSENREQVQYFLSKNPNFELLKERQILPQDFGFDGFYMACLQRNS
ncbi:MAG: RNA methyltransferase [Bacteroidetes bacterium]|nr:MAG: RNA methyltransferase [Bacteroidota bacterium]